MPSCLKKGSLVCCMITCPLRWPSVEYIVLNWTKVSVACSPKMSLKETRVFLSGYVYMNKHITWIYEQHSLANSTSRTKKIDVHSTLFVFFSHN